MIVHAASTASRQRTAVRSCSRKRLRKKGIGTIGKLWISGLPQHAIQEREIAKPDLTLVIALLTRDFARA